MSNYTQNTFFANKDNLASGNPSKVIYGSEVDAEFAEISSAISSQTEGEIPSATVMLFMQAAAPTGWTLVTTWNDRALTITSTAAQGGGTGGNWTLTLSGNVALVNHTHGAGNLTGSVSGFSGNVDGADAGTGILGPNAGTMNTVTVNAGATAVPNGLPNSPVVFGGTLGNTLTAGNWRPAYARAIACSKN